MLAFPWKSPEQWQWHETSRIGLLLFASFCTEIVAHNRYLSVTLGNTSIGLLNFGKPLKLKILICLKEQNHKIGRQKIINHDHDKNNSQLPIFCTSSMISGFWKLAEILIDKPSYRSLTPSINQILTLNSALRRQGKVKWAKSIPARKSRNQQNFDRINEVKSSQKVQIPPIIRSGLIDDKNNNF